jgi:hypothetical protein
MRGSGLEPRTRQECKRQANGRWMLLFVTQRNFTASTFQIWNALGLRLLILLRCPMPDGTDRIHQLGALAKW